MILKTLREKSNQKHINKLLNVKREIVDNVPIKSLGVILNLSEFDDLEAFREFGKELNINPNNVKILGYTDYEKDVNSSREMLFSKKEIGWNAKIKSSELEDFLNKRFDALIGFYKNESTDINLAIALSKAHFKIGISSHDERLFDLIIESDTNGFDVFKKELIKYLGILNKLSK